MSTETTFEQFVAERFTGRRADAAADRHGGLPMSEELRERLLNALSANAYRGAWDSGRLTMQPMSWSDDDVVDRLITDAGLGLDAAWAEAEAALPDGAYLWLHRVASGAYYVSAFRNDQPIVARLSTVSADGDTPAAALRALAARLTKHPEEPA